jgi:hypothetical protein
MLSRRVVRRRRAGARSGRLVVAGLGEGGEAADPAGAGLIAEDQPQHDPEYHDERHPDQGGAHRAAGALPGNRQQDHGHDRQPELEPQVPDAGRHLRGADGHVREPEAAKHPVGEPEGQRTARRYRGRDRRRGLGLHEPAPEAQMRQDRLEGQTGTSRLRTAAAVMATAQAELIFTRAAHAPW